MKYLNDSAIDLKKPRSGIFISQNRIVCFGPIDKLDLHHHGATVLQIGLFSPFYIRFDRKWIATRCALIPAGYQHEIHYPKGIFGKLFVELGSSDHYSLIDKYHYNPVNISIFNDMDAVNCFQKIYTDAFDLQSVNQYIDTLINFNQYNAAGFDFRINIALGIMDAEIDRNFSLKSLSNHVGISPSRFQHLFKEQVGIPFTQYRLWRRIREAEIVMNQTDSLTTASLQVGFSDLPHFSRKYKETFGIVPSKVFIHLVDFEIDPSCIR